jgi:hypothetical protein
MESKTDVYYLSSYFLIRMEYFMKVYRDRRSYGLTGFVFDAFMVLITGGLWFIRIFVREMRIL